MTENYARGTCGGAFCDLGSLEAVLFVISRFGVDFLNLLGLSWGRLGVLLGHFGMLLGRFEVLLGRCVDKVRALLHLPYFVFGCSWVFGVLSWGFVGAR